MEVAVVQMLLCVQYSCSICLLRQHRCLVVLLSVSLRSCFWSVFVLNELYFMCQDTLCGSVPILAVLLLREYSELCCSSPI